MSGFWEGVGLWKAFWSGMFYSLIRKEQAFTKLTRQVASYFRMDLADLKLSGKTPNLVRAKSVICYVAVRHLGLKVVDVGRRLAIRSAMPFREAPSS